MGEIPGVLHKGCHLAEVNMSLLKPDVGAGEVASLNAAIDPFVGRALREHKAFRAFVDPADQRVMPGGIFSDPHCLVNLTVWDIPEALLQFLQEAHRRVWSRYEGLFDRIGEAAVAL